MACQKCINRQKKIVEYLCKKSEGYLCRRAQKRLKNMEAPKK